MVTPNDEGLWSTVTALGELQRRYYDPAGRTAGYFGLLEESGEPAVAALRLKVEGRTITEAAVRAMPVSPASREASYSTLKTCWPTRPTKVLCR